MSSYSPGLTENLSEPVWLEGSRGRLAFHPYRAQRPWLRLLISHGFGEHSGWWHHVACALRERGISAYLFDHYHHGRSAGASADVSDYAVLVDGLRLALEEGIPLREDASGENGPKKQGSGNQVSGNPHPPLVILGHSNGALVSLLALDGPLRNRVSGLVLSSPFLGMRFPMDLIGPPLEAVLGLINPSLRLPLTSRPKQLTGNRAIWAHYGADPLRFRNLTVRFFQSMVRTVREGRGVTGLGGIPLLLLSAGDEQVVGDRAASDWYGRLREPGKERRVYPGLRHEMFNEQEWETVLGDMVEWCRSRFDSQSRNPDSEAQIPERESSG